MALPQAVLFDLDNTLVDRAASLKEYAYRFFTDFRDQLARGEGRKVFDVITSVDSGGYAGWDAIHAELLSRLTWLDKPDMMDLAYYRHLHYTQSAKPMPGLYPTLRHLYRQGILLGIITNGSEHSQQGKIDLLELAPFMTSITISGALGIKKPDPRIFEVALSALGASAQHSWIVGDHPINDIVGGQQVGLTPVWRRGFHPWPAAYPEPAYQIDSLSELTDLLDF